MTENDKYQSNGSPDLLRNATYKWSIHMKCAHYITFFPF